MYTPVQLVFNALQHLIGGQGAGRVYVFGALFLCGFAAMTLLSDHAWWVQCTVGVLAMLNPFVYDRLVEGQWGVVAATAGLFLFMAAWWRLGDQPGPLSAAGVIAAGLFTLMFSADFAGILLVLAAGLAAFNSKWRVSAIPTVGDRFLCGGVVAKPLRGHSVFHWSWSGHVSGGERLQRS